MSPAHLSSSRLAVWGLLLLLGSGCSSFNRDWRQAAKQPPAPDELAGRWEGRWSSDYNGHNGKLRCLMTRESPTEYAARFRASYLGILRFEYTVPLQVSEQTDGWTFSGAADLGKAAGGVYHYQGAVTEGTNFHSSYRATVDHGEFHMQKVPGRR
jgi:hypothetical protein